MNWILKNKWKIIVCIAIVFILLFLGGCSNNSQLIEGNATVLNRYNNVNPRNGEVSNFIIVFGYAECGTEVTERWCVLPSLFIQIEVGDEVRLINGNVVKIERYPVRDRRGVEL
jgi:hypothetical protein